MFSFEQLDVYQCAVRFVALSARIISSLPRGYGSLSDQLKRAALSVPANIAEAVGRTSEADKRRHFGIARGSAMESAAILGACQVLELADQALVDEARHGLVRVVSMLSKMCR